MERDIVSRRDNPDDLALRWSGRVSLTPRILAVNIFALTLLAGSLFYLDGYRSRLILERADRARLETKLVAAVLAVAPRNRRGLLIDNFGQLTGGRLRLFDLRGQIISDSWPEQQTAFDLVDRDYPPWQQSAARWLDIGIDFIVGAIEPPAFGGFDDPAANIASVTLAADRTHVISARATVQGPNGFIVVSNRNARDIRQIVRAERGTLGIAVGVATLLSVLLSLFLARTIVRPLRLLARAAVRVRLGRSRDVVIPRLPTRRDEIGMLARAVSDMSQALRQRIDATEAFAADVSHELKNPLASLRSAIESLQAVSDPALHLQLLTIASDDVRRLDRLINDMSELSRIDAKLTRTRFEPVDIHAIIRQIVDLRAARPGGGNPAISLICDTSVAIAVRGDAAQLARVVENLLDNAVSFSPPDGKISLTIQPDDDHVMIAVDDEGPGISVDLSEAIFERFHSDRPDGEAFGQHSGLGLAIARTIINGHGGSIVALGKPTGETGARFVIRLPIDRDG